MQRDVENEAGFGGLGRVWQSAPLQLEYQFDSKALAALWIPLAQFEVRLLEIALIAALEVVAHARICLLEVRFEFEVDYAG